MAKDWREHGLDWSERFDIFADALQSCHGNVVAIAIECGFNDLSYFNRSFRRAYGATPSDVREDAQRTR